MRIPLALSVYLAIIPALSSQTNAIFSFEDEVPEAVTHIFINLNFNHQDEIPSTICNFRNLEELIFFDQSLIYMETPFTLGKSTKSSTELIFSGIKDVLLYSVPEEISACQNLSVLKIPVGSISDLPLSLTRLNKLRVLQLPMGTPLDSMINVLAQLSSLEVLECWECPISNESREKLTKGHSELIFIINQEEMFRPIVPRPKFSILMDCRNGPCGLNFVRTIEAEMFIRSMPEEERMKYQPKLKD